MNVLLKAHDLTAYHNLYKDASQKYLERFDNDVYRSATIGKSARYANELLDNAMALCGNPSYRVTFRKWNESAQDFLELFQ